jgi:uracil-DNA glycosylase
MSADLQAMPASWVAELSAEFDQPYWRALCRFVAEQYDTRPCFPPRQAIFKAFEATPFDKVRVVILGQDPYHTPGAAMGLAFSIPEGSKAQPSLKNIFNELASDLGYVRINTDLSDWAEQGVLLLNTVLTVQEGVAASHAGKGWETLTDAVIQTLSARRSGIVFVLWGAHALSKRRLIDEGRHHVVVAPHPSPLSAYRGFFGSKPFSKINGLLQVQGGQAIRW